MRDKPAYESQFDLGENAVGVVVSSKTEAERGLAVIQTINEQQANTQKEFAHQVQPSLAFRPERRGVQDQ